MLRIALASLCNVSRIHDNFIQPYRKRTGVFRLDRINYLSVENLNSKR